MKSFYFIRHGQTFFNVLNKVQGASDSLLTDAGESAAADLGQKFKSQNITFDIAYTSDSGRARQTAKLFIAHSGYPNAPLIETADLREVSFGSYEGESNDLLWADARKESHLPITEASTDEEKIHVLSAIKRLDATHMAEDYEEVTRRINRILKLAHRSDASSLLFFSHGLFINCLLYLLTDQKLNVTHIENTSVTKIIDDGDAFHIDYISATEHF